MFPEHPLCVIRVLGKADGALGKTSAAVMCKQTSGVQAGIHTRVMGQRGDLGEASKARTHLGETVHTGGQRKATCDAQETR